MDDHVIYKGEALPELRKLGFKFKRKTREGYPVEDFPEEWYVAEGNLYEYWGGLRGSIDPHSKELTLLSRFYLDVNITPERAIEIKIIDRSINRPEANIITDIKYTRTPPVTEEERSAFVKRLEEMLTEVAPKWNDPIASWKERYIGIQIKGVFLQGIPQINREELLDILAEASQNLPGRNRGLRL